MREYTNIDEIGHIYGKWVVLNYAGRYRDGCVGWLCRCACGMEKIVNGKSLRAGESKSCGCAAREAAALTNFIDLTGMVYGRLTVIHRVPNKGKATAYLCRCICGKETIVKAGNLKSGTTQSCGCLAQEVRSRNGINNPNHTGRKTDSGGYTQVYKPDHLNAFKDGYVSEHVFIMSEYLGRPLNKKETVHHKNGIRKQNNIENLELWASRHPPGQKVSDLVAWAKELLIEYKPTALK